MLQGGENLKTNRLHGERTGGKNAPRRRELKKKNPARRTELKNKYAAMRRELKTKHPAMRREATRGTITEENKRTIPFD